MITTMKRWAALALASAVVLTSFVPSQAMPLPTPVITAPSDVTNVDYRRRPPYYYRGHRGYEHRRPGYRFHNGYWFPLAAFATGAIIGGAIATQPAPRGVGGINPKHYQWCANRYRSYDSYSNTFQPYHGPRQRCYSPYY